MTTLNIHTKIYHDELARVFPISGDEDSVREHSCVNGVYYVCVYNRQSTRRKLQSLMEYIILNDNPVLADSEKVFGSVAELAFQPTRGIMKIQLEEFLKENHTINIEGYINFRLGEYSGRINAILYSIVKKNLYKS